MGFRFDTRHLPKETQQIISKGDKINSINRESSKNQHNNCERRIYPVSIFMRLGNDSFSKMNGVKTISTYRDFCLKNKAVWFSTDSLAFGMSETRRCEFINAIKNGHIVLIFFAIGKNGGGNNDMEYMAEVQDIRTDKEGINSPEEILTPDEWKNENSKIWIKIKGISDTTLKASDFMVQSTRNILSKSIGNSQYHFGYIIRKSMIY